MASVSKVALKERDPGNLLDAAPPQLIDINSTLHREMFRQERPLERTQCAIAEVQPEYRYTLTTNPILQLDWSNPGHQ